MLNLLKKIIPVNFLLLIALIGAGVYFAPLTSSTRAADNDFLLTWSSDSYVPLGYEGKALPSRGSLIKINVIPTKMLPSNPDFLYYRWLVDDELVYSTRGQGKSSLLLRVTKWGGDSYKVTSQILDSQENTVWRGSITIKIASPQVLLKSADSGYALADSMIAGVGKNLNLIALPFFFHAQKPSDLTFNWTVDKQKPAASDEKNPDQLIIKIPTANLSQSVFKDLSLAVKNKLDRLQQFTVNLIIEIK
ncbi:hypothetical protein KJ866_04690 [Patescibacteria group bacterium]|nr:hypothetical protein [Patescibacteria group bacterium]